MSQMIWGYYNIKNKYCKLIKTGFTANRRLYRNRIHERVGLGRILGRDGRHEKIPITCGNHLSINH